MTVSLSQNLSTALERSRSLPPSWSLSPSHFPVLSAQNFVCTSNCFWIGSHRAHIPAHIPLGKCSVLLKHCEKLFPSTSDFKELKAWYRHRPSEHLRRCSATEKCHNYICSWVLLQQCASKIISAVFLFITHQTLQRPRLLEGTTCTEAEQLFCAYYLGCWVPQIAGGKQVNCHLSVTCYQVLILWDIFGALTADPSNKNFEVFQEAEWG